jgi:hypothetical protein
MTVGQKTVGRIKNLDRKSLDELAWLPQLSLQLSDSGLDGSGTAEPLAF